MEYTTLEEIVKLLEEKYRLDKHFGGWVMLIFKKYLDVKVPKDLDIEYLAKAYKNESEFLIDTLYLEVCYEDGFSCGSFVNYCAPEINKYLIQDSENKYYVSKENMNLVYNKIKEMAEEFKKEDLVSPNEVYKILTEEYQINTQIVELYNINGKIPKKEIVNIAKNLLNDASNKPFINFLANKINEHGLKNLKREFENSKEDVVYSTTLYKLLTEKCGEDNGCANYIFEKEFNGDILIPENLVKSYENLIDEYIPKYHGWKKNLKEEIDLGYIR